MLRYKYIVFLIFLLPLIGACSSSDFVPEEADFPLVQSHVLHVDETIYHLSTSESALVFDTVNSVQGIDSDSFEISWKVDGYSPRVDSDILFADDYPVLMSYDEILVVDGKGRETYLNLNKNRQDNIDLVAAYGDLVYVIRGGLWDLEVYDISKNEMIWETPTGRGGTSVYFEASLNISYVVNPSSVRAFNTSTGEMLWGQDVDVSESVYQTGILYIASTKLNSKKYSITAVDVINRKTIWYREFDVDLEMYIEKIDVFQNIVVMTTASDGLLAFESSSGEPKWVNATGDAYYTRPVLFKNTLYVKGSSKRVYAISLTDGKTIGYVRLEPDAFFAEPSYEANSGVYLFHDGIVFKTENSIWFYESK